MADFKEFKVKLTVDTKDGTKQIEQTIGSVKDYEKVLDDLNKKKTKPGISEKELKAIDKEIKNLSNSFEKAGNKIHLMDQDLEVTQANLKALIKEQKKFGAGTDEYKRAADKIADFKDKLEGAKRTQISLGEQLEAAPGPLGMFFSGLDKVKNSFTTLGGAIKASGVGLLVSIIGGIVAAFSNVEGSGKKLQPLLIGMEKIFGGIVNVLQPVLDMFLDLGLKALPYVTNAFKYVYAGITTVFQSVGKLASAVVKLVKGDFSGAWEDAKSSVTDFGKNFDKNVLAFEAGAAKVTKTQKENADKQREKALARLDEQKEEVDKAIALEVNRVDTNKELLEAELKKKDEIENKKWSLEHKGRQVSKETLQLQAEERKKFIDAALKSDKDAADEKLQQQKDAEKALLEDLDKYLDEQNKKIDKAREQANKKELQALKQQLIDGKITKAQYDQQILDANVEAAKKKQKQDEDAANTRFAWLTNMYLMGYLKEETFLLELQKLNDWYNQAKTDNEIAVTDATQERDITNKENRIEREKAAYEQLKELEKAYTEASLAYKNSIADAVGTLGSIIQGFASDNKDLAIFGLILEKAAAIASVILNSQANAANIKAAHLAAKIPPIKPFPFPPYFIPNPAYITDKGIEATQLATNRVQTGVALAGIGVAAIQGIAGINAAAKQKAESKKAFGGILKGPTHAMGGITTPFGELEGGEFVVNRASTMMMRPALETINAMGGGARDYGYAGYGGNTNKMETPIIKTYVVASEMSSQQEMDRVIKNRSKF